MLESHDINAQQQGDRSHQAHQGNDAELLSRFANSLPHHPVHHGHHKHHKLHNGSGDTGAAHLHALHLTNGENQDLHLHVVKKGENLTRIARESLGKGASEQDIYKAIQKIVKENHIKDPNLILPGQEIHLPDSILKHEQNGRPAQQHKPGEHKPEHRAPEKKTPEKKAPEKKTPEKKTPEHKAPQQPEHQAPGRPQAPERPADPGQPTRTEQPKPPQLPADSDKTHTPPVAAKMSQGAVDKAVQDIHDAAHKRNLGGYGWSSPDKDPIKTILGTANEADRAVIEKAYEAKFKTPLKADVEKQFSGDHVATSEIEALMNRKDGKSDEAGQIHNALAKIEGQGPVYPGDSTSDQARAEGQIRNSLSTMTAKQIAEVQQTYQQNYGKSLATDLSSDPNLSDESKQALAIYMKGIDKRTPEDTAKLAQIGLTSQRLDIFQEAMEYASPEARRAFINNGGQQKIDQAFIGDDNKIAQDYARNGSISLVTLVEGDTHWYHTNKTEINRAVENCSLDEKAKFQLGKRLADSGSATKSAAETDAVRFYNDTEKAFHSAGNDREAQICTAKLNSSESIVSNILQTQHDGFIGIGKGHDKSALYGSVENMSEQDWQSFKAHPEHLKDVDAALQTISDDSERARIMGMLHEKLGVNSFTESQNVGRRNVTEAISDAGSDPTKQIDALMHMSAAEKNNYRANSGQIDRLVAENIKTDGASLVARDLLAQVKAGQEPQLSALDKVAMGSEMTDNALGTTADIEAAFKADPTLLERVKHPQSDADKKLAGIFHSALNNAVDKAGLGARSVGKGGEIPSQSPNFAKTLFENGHLDIDQKMQLIGAAGDNKQAVLAVLQTATPEERTRLLTPNPDAQAKQLQDSVLGNGPERKLYENVLKQGNLDQVDQFRAFALGAPCDSSAYLQTLSNMTPEQKQDLANKYFTKYGSLISEDVVGGAKSSEKFRFVELLSPTDQSVRQVTLDSRVANDSHTSVFDDAMRNCWDYSGVAAQENSRQLEKFVAQHADEIDHLSPQQKKQFDDAVNNYIQAQQGYVDSKGAAAEAVVDAAITVAAIGGAFFTGGTSLALLGAIGAGGAAFRVVAMRAMEGSDFDPSLHNIAEQAFKGGTGAMLGFVGPEMFGIKGLAAVGEAAAARTTVNIMEKAAAEGIEQTAFRGGEDAAKKVITDGLAALTKREAIAGGKGMQAAIKDIAEKALGETATAEQKAALESTIRQELKAQVTKTLRDKLLNESESAFLNIATASTTNAGVELASTAVGLSDPNTLFDRMSSAAISGAAGAAVFHVAFRVGAAGFHGLKASMGRDAGGLFAGEGTKIRHADGSETTVKGDEKYRFKAGDKVVEQERNVSNEPEARTRQPKTETPTKGPAEARTTDTPSRLSRQWTDTEGRQWTRNSITDTTWRTADGATYTRASGKEDWQFPDGRKRVRYKTGEEYTFDPKSDTWTDHEGTKIRTLSDRVTRVKTDGTQIEELKDTTLTTKNNVTEITNGTRTTRVEFGQPPSKEINRITFPDGRTLVRNDANSFREEFPAGDARTAKVVETDYKLGSDGRLIGDDGIAETTLHPDGRIERHSSPQIFQVVGHVSDAFRAKADRALLDLPPEVRQLMRKNGTKVVIGDTIGDIDPTLVNLHPRGHAEGATWANVEGYYDLKRNIAVVTEHYKGLDGTVHTSNRTDGALRHEVGHAVEIALGDYRNKAEFKSAYFADLENIETKLTAGEKEKLAYYLQLDPRSGSRTAGRSEAFAELFGVLNGGGGQFWDKDLILKAFPNTMKAIEARMARLRATGN